MRRGVKPRARLSQAKFNAVLLLLPKALEKRREMARLILVEGETYKDVAEKYQCTRQSVLTAVDSVWDMAERFNIARAMVLSDPDEPG